jgi:hypothetical protein
MGLGTLIFLARIWIEVGRSIVSPDKSMKMKRILVFASLAVAVTFWACSKDSASQNQSQLRIRLTDNPFNAAEVNVEILKVRVNFRGDDTGWVDLETRAGIYDLLKLQNGVDTLLAQGTVPADTLKEIRFVLGKSNSIKIGSDSFPLVVPSGQESGLKIKLSKKLNATLENVVVDFDAALSIHQTGNGKYMLKPVLKIK